MKLQVSQLQTYLSIAILIGKAVAPRTETKLDDKAVELAERLAANTVVLAIFAQLLSGEAPTPPATPMSEASKALLRDVKANLPVLTAMVTSASAVC